MHASKLQKHTEVVAMLKEKHGLTHGAAHRIGLLARADSAPKTTAATEEDPAAAFYAGKKEPLRPIHDALMKAVGAFAKELEVAPKTGYVSLRRQKQFAMIKPAAKHVDVGLILKDMEPAERLEPSGSFNALFTHRVRVPSVAAVDKELVGWLRKAYGAAE